MEIPGIVQSELDGEDVAAGVSLGGEDGLYVTPTRTLVYHSESLLSDESVDEFPHDAERVTVNEGRRKTRITLTYGIEGERDFTVPASADDDVLHPVLAGVLNGTGVTAPGETVVQTFRFSELTLVVTSERLVKHVGSAVWDADHEEYHFEDVTRLAFEEGSVATQIVLDVDGRPQRIKTPNEHVAAVRERLSQALFAYYDVDTLAAFNELAGAETEPVESTGGAVDFGEGIDPLGADSSGDRPADTSGDPFLDDENEASLTGSDGDPATEDDPRRPRDGTDQRGNRRRAEPAEQSGNRRAQPASDSGPESNASAGAAAGSTNATGDDHATNGDGVRSADVASTDDGTADPLAGDDAGRVDDGSADASAGTADADANAGEASEEPGEFEAAGFEPATASDVDTAELAARLDGLEERVEAQNQLLERQQALIQQLVEELRDR